MPCGQSSVTWMNRPEIDDPRFRTNDDRCKNYLPDLKEIVESYTKPLRQRAGKGNE